MFFPPEMNMSLVNRLRRGWVYPQSIELYQLLHKATIVALARPDQRILPVLVCRKAHWTLYPMAKQLGFMVIEMGRQFAGDVGEDEVAELRSELHFQDLVAGTEPSLKVRDRFRTVLPQHGEKFAEAWQRTSNRTDLVFYIEKLRYETKVVGRASLMSQFRRVAGQPGGW